MSQKSEQFTWRTYDLRSTLPDGWRSSILDLAVREGRTVMLDPKSVTSREERGHPPLRSRIVDGKALADRLAWFHELYRGRLRDLVQQSYPEQITVAEDPRHGLLMQIQDQPDARYECHVDSASITGIFYATNQPPGSGGELIVANRTNTRGIAAIDSDASRIHPVAGHFIVFEAHRHAHYVSALTKRGDLRVAIAMSFFSETQSESMRAADLDDHLGI